MVNPPKEFVSGGVSGGPLKASPRHKGLMPPMSSLLLAHRKYTDNEKEITAN